MACPPLLELSQFLDTELDADVMQRIEQHRQHCQSCAEHLRRLEGFSVDRTSQPTVESTGSCPSPERLLAVLHASTTDAAIDIHLRECDPCTHLLQRFQRAMAMATEMSVAVPPSLRQQAIAWAEPQPAAAPRPKEQSSWWERVRAGLRYPVLMPAAFAAGMLLYVVALQVPLMPGVPAGSRSAAQPVATRRVIASEARVFAEANARAQLVERLARGSVVEISFEERGWYRVTLADGRQGWIEQHALQ